MKIRRFERTLAGLACIGLLASAALIAPAPSWGADAPEEGGVSAADQGVIAGGQLTGVSLPAAAIRQDSQVRDQAPLAYGSSASVDASAFGSARSGAAGGLPSQSSDPASDASATAARSADDASDASAAAALSADDAVAATSDSFTYGDFECSYSYDGGVYIDKYLGSAENVTVPGYINGKKVSAVFAFEGNTKIKTVTLSEGIGRIGSYTFNGCTNLVSISLPSTLTEINTNAFGGCAFTSVTLPAGLKKLSSRSFYACPNLTTVTIPANLEPVTGDVDYTEPPTAERLQADAMNPIVSCRSFKGYTVAANCKNFKVVDGALLSKDGTIFYGYPFGRVSTSFTVPNGVKAIAQDAFGGCPVSQVSIPNGVWRIGSDAFSASWITSISLPDSVTQIDLVAFRYCDKLTSVRLSSKLEKVGYWVFSNCPALKTVTNTKGVNYLDYGAFAYDKALTGFEFGEKMRFIHEYAFYEAGFSPKIPSYMEKNSEGNYVVYDDKVTLTGDDNYDYAKQVLSIVNQKRADQGLAALQLDADLTKAAMQRAAECALNFSHTRPSGEDCFSISAKASGENIAAGSSTPADVMDDWMNSPGHRANILTADFKSIGIGCFKIGSVYYWVQLFGTGTASGSVRGGSSQVTHPINVNKDTVPMKAAFNRNMAQDDPVTLEKGATYQLSVDVLNPGWDSVYAPLDASGFTWTSSDPSKVSVSATGLVTARVKESGEVTITAKSKHGITTCSRRFKAQPVYYTVSFNDGYSGTELFTQKVEKGQPAKQPADPVRKDYRFEGWYYWVSDETLEMAKWDFSKPIPSETFILNAKWSYAPVYTVTFESNGGSAVAAQQVEGGKAAAKPADPTRAGYEFRGWYWDSSFRTPYDFSSAVGANLTLYAKWEKKAEPAPQPKTFTVGFEPNGGSAVAAQRVAEGQKATRPADPSRSGYTFKGWYADKGLAKAYDFNAAVGANLTLYAKWEKKAEPAPIPRPEGTGFSDVPANHWVYVQGWLSYATSHGLMGGYQGKFAPDDTLTRGQVAAVLYRIANPGSDATTNEAHYGKDTGFKDGGSQRYYYAAVKWLKAQGISTGDKRPDGTPLGTFRPDDPITRQELAAMVYRFAQKMGAGTSESADISSFKDAGQVQPYAVEPLSWCLARGIITGGQGDAAGLVMPGQNATRAQAAKIFTVVHRDVLKR